MAISSVAHQFGRCLAILTVCLPVSAALAGAGFVAESRIVPDAGGADIEIRFNCKVSYLQHEPPESSDRLLILLDPTGICNGVSPGVSESRMRFRPANADAVGLVDLEYDGHSPSGSTLILNFAHAVAYSIEAHPVSFGLTVRVRSAEAQLPAPNVRESAGNRLVVRPEKAAPIYVINLQSMRRMPTVADIAQLQSAEAQRIFYNKVVLDGATWYRLRLGNFSTRESAHARLTELRPLYPGAWIDHLDVDADAAAIDATPDALSVSNFASDESTESASFMTAAGESPPGEELSKVDRLMEDARRMMIEGNRGRAIQIYTKILQLPEHARQAEAQEYLALAREKNGQLAHAKAEYQRYLTVFPDSEGADRVRRRLSALLASNRLANAGEATSSRPETARRSTKSDWRVQTFVSQYYRRDANQQSDADEIVSQSALYSDFNIDARRRGERFDFSSRLSAGYRYDLLGPSEGSGDETRISHAYADLADTVTGLRARIGRQSRNTGGVLGRFDGVNIGYTAIEKVALNAVIGKPAYSATDGVDSGRSFYGFSANYGPLIDGLELGMFYIRQEIQGIQDREAVGGEFRYFGPRQSVWGLVDYDTLYNELGSAFLQASWRFGSRLTVHGSLDKRHSPFLSTGNALIGQPVLTFAELLETYPVGDIRQFANDRSPVSTTYTLGVSHSLNPRLQLNADLNETSVAETPESGGVFATPASEYRYVSTNLVASSLLKDGDVTILGARLSESESSRVLSVTIDSRYPFGHGWRINPRLRVDRRERAGEAGFEWIYAPGIRIQYRRGQRMRIELDAGKQFAERDSQTLNLDRESYYVSLGYHAFF